MVIWFPLRNVRSKYKCALTMHEDMVLVVRPYVTIYIYMVTNIQAWHEAIQFSPPNLSEGGLLRSPNIGS